LFLHKKGELKMARGTPTAIKGTVLAGSQRRYQFIKKIEDACVAYLSNGEPAWEVDVIDSSQTTYDIVLHSVGDRSLGSGTNKGDIDIWSRLHIVNGNTTVNNFLDWCPTDESSQRETGDKLVTMSDVGEFDYWIVVNEYECIAVAVQGGSYFFCHFGHPVTGIEDTKIGGVARVATQTSGTGTVVVDLDRDISSQITVGQRVWLLNQTPDGAGTCESVKIEIVDVDAVTASTITLSGVANDAYSVGSLVGLYRGYTFCNISLDVARSTYQWAARDDTSGPYSYAYPDVIGLTEAANDPDYSGLYPLLRVLFNFSNSRGSPGYPEHMYATPLGTQAVGDRMIVGGDVTKAYWFFPNLAISSLKLCIGPGATS